MNAGVIEFPRHTELGGGWHQVESGYFYSGHAAIYVLAIDGRALVFDAAHSGSVDRVLATLADIDVDPANVDYLVISHAHLDHCGGAGSLARKLPNAKVLAHEQTVGHLVEPAQLIAGASQLYGERMEALYGEILAVDADRAAAVQDGETLEFQGRKLEFLDTPGHTFNHICLYDRTGDCTLAGDVFGVFTPTEYGVPVVMRIPAAPTQFAPAEWKKSVRRLVGLGTGRILVTHYGEVGESVGPYGAELIHEIDHFVDLARQAKGQEQPREFLREEITRHWMAKLGVESLPEHVLDIDTLLSTTGVELWMNKHLDSYEG